MSIEKSQIQWFAVVEADGYLRKNVKEVETPKRIIRIIVNSQFLRDTAQMGNKEAKSALDKIEEWKVEPDFKEVNLSSWLVNRSKDLLHDLRLDLPNPDSSFQIEVCGVNTDMSNIILLYEMRKAGYNAKFSKTASCAGRTEPPQMVISDILDRFPDFFD